MDNPPGLKESLLNSSPAIWRRLDCRVVLAISIISAIVIMVRFDPTAPLKSGNAREFWLEATGIDPIGDPRLDRWNQSHSSAYLIEEGAAVIYSGKYQDADHNWRARLYVLPEREALEHFDIIRTRLAKNCAESMSLNLVCKAYAEANRSSDKDAAVVLGQFLRQSRLEYARFANVETADLYWPNQVGAEEDEINRKWRSHQTHQVAWFFEWAFFTLAAIFVAWPSIVDASPVRWAIHWALLPLLLLLPFYLGYGFAAVAGNELCGEVVYADLIRCLPEAELSELDRSILDHIPHLLGSVRPKIVQPISVGASPISESLLRSKVGLVAPSVAISLGLCLGLVVFVARKLFSARIQSPQSQSLS